MIAIVALITALVCLACYAYFALTQRKFKMYLWSNLLGGGILAVFNVSTFGIASAANVVIEVFYAAIAAVALWRLR